MIDLMIIIFFFLHKSEFFFLQQKPFKQLFCYQFDEIFIKMSQINLLEALFITWREKLQQRSFCHITKYSKFQRKILYFDNQFGTQIKLYSKKDANFNKFGTKHSHSQFIWPELCFFLTIFLEHRNQRSTMKNQRNGQIDEISKKKELSQFIENTH